MGQRYVVGDSYISGRSRVVSRRLNFVEVVLLVTVLLLFSRGLGCRATFKVVPDILVRTRQSITFRPD